MRWTTWKIIVITWASLMTIGCVALVYVVFSYGVFADVPGAAFLMSLVAAACWIVALGFLKLRG